ncbi:MAG: hypothetical protein P4L81_04355 [Candidatus Pacebacteria bacterium]|nr:hypothetical protein [Candidatus Paceibacterota bacterium]
MRRATVLCLIAATFAFGPASAQAGSLIKANFTPSETRNFTPVPKRVDPNDKTAWICSTNIGSCYYGFPTYPGGPCSCCNGYGCFSGVVTGYSSIDHNDHTAQNQ